MKKTGFTIGELAVTLGVIGILAASLYPVVNDSKPSQEAVMFKKAYYIVERSLYEMINDDNLYKKDPASIIDKGFGNTEEATYKSVTTSGASKFCEIFAAKLNTMRNSSCTENKSFPNGNFRTSDNMVWVVPVSTIANVGNVYPIYVDVNGSDGSNCFYNADNRNSCSNPDRFTIYFYPDGRVVARGTAERALLKEAKISASKVAGVLYRAPKGNDTTAVKSDDLLNGIAQTSE